MASATREPERLSPFERVRTRATLRAALAHVQAAAARSTSAGTRDAVARFAAHADRHLARSAKQLREGRFAFAPARGIACDRPGKRPRPIVVAPVENRVVQRAILDVLTDIPAIAGHLTTSPTSFGGVAGRGV